MPTPRELNFSYTIELLSGVYGNPKSILTDAEVDCMVLATEFAEKL